MRNTAHRRLRDEASSDVNMFERCVAEVRRLETAKDKRSELRQAIVDVCSADLCEI